MKQSTAAAVSTRRPPAKPAAVSILGLMAALTLAVALPGCVVAPDQSHNVGGVVLIAPPPPQEESIGVPAANGDVWIGGYWNWVGGHYEWVPGHFAPGRTGHHWVTPHWVRQGDGWRLQPGRWIRD